MKRGRGGFLLGVMIAGMALNSLATRAGGITIPAEAQQNASPAAPAASETKFRILGQTQINLGDHKLILNRVVPPVLPAAPVKIQQEVAKVVQTEVVEAAKPDKPREVLFLSATVYDHKFSEIRWMDGGQQWSAFSNADFNLMEAMGTFETADTEYFLLLALTNRTTGANRLFDPGAGDGETAGRGKQIPRLEKLSTTRAQYLIVEDEAGATPQAKDLAALDALHLYYDANRQRLAEDYARRDTMRIERERWLKEHPPVPEDTVINYWVGQGATAPVDKRSMGGARP